MLFDDNRLKIGNTPRIHLNPNEVLDLIVAKSLGYCGGTPFSGGRSTTIYHMGGGGGGGHLWADGYLT